MAITSVREISPARDNVLDVLAGWKREYTRAFLVRSDTAAENIVTVRTASAGGNSVPIAMSGHPNDTRAKLVRKLVKQSISSEAARKLWLVTCQYSTLNREQQKKNTHPLDRPWEIEWDGETFQTIAEQDLFGNPINNSAGQYFDPPVQVDNVRPTLVIQRNEASFNGSLALQYQEAINSDPFFGGAPYTVKCKKIKSKRVIEEWAPATGEDPIEVEYWPTTYEFHYWYRTWWLFPLDQGRYEHQSGQPELVSIKDSDGIPVVDPVPLNGFGLQVPPADLPQGAFFMTYRYYRELPFAAFGFT